MWVTKLLIFPVEIRIYCFKTTKFGQKLAFLTIAGSFGALRQTNSIMNETFEKVIFEVIMCANIIVCAKITIPIIPNF